MRKFLAVLLTMVLLCGLGSGVLAEEREYVEIDWYFFDGNLNTAANDLVDAALNEYFIEKLNTKVNFHHTNDYSTKLPTMISAGQDLGIVMFGTQLSYVNQAARGAFLRLDELLPEYMPNTYALFSPEMWDGMRVNGDIYGIPTWKDNCYIMGMYYDQDMADALGIDVESYDFNVYQDLVPLFYDVKEKRDEMYPDYANYPVSAERWGIFPYDFALECFSGELLCANLPGYEAQGADDYTSDTVYCLYETEDFTKYALLMQQLVDDGIYAYDAPSDQWSSEKIFCWPGWGYVTIDEHMVSDDFVSTLYIPNLWWIDTANLNSAGNGISSQCANPERAAEILELVNTDSFVATTLRFGVEGTHWVRDDEGKITFEGTINEKRDVYYHWYGGEFGSMSAVEVPDFCGGSEFIDLIKYYNETAVLADNLGFVFDTTNVLNEIAACNNVVSEYKRSFQNGLYEDQDEVMEMLEEFRGKLKANGIDTLKEECQRQLTEWRAARGK